MSDTFTTLHQRAAQAADVSRTREFAPLREFHALLSADLVAARGALDAVRADIEAHRPRLESIRAQLADERYDRVQGRVARLVADARATATGKLAQCTNSMNSLSRWIERIEGMQPEDLASAPVATYVEEERYRLAGLLVPLDVGGTCVSLEALAQEIIEALPGSVETPVPGRALREDERRQLRAETVTHARRAAPEDE
jgi:hypothetical protein